MEQAEELRKADIQAQQEFADRFPNGKLVLYDVPHYMEPEIPEEIAAEIRAVIDAALPLTGSSSEDHIGRRLSPPIKRPSGSPLPEDCTTSNGSLLVQGGAGV